MPTDRGPSPRIALLLRALEQGYNKKQLLKRLQGISRKAAETPETLE